MLYELRTYTVMPGRMPDLHKRFSELTLAYFKAPSGFSVGSPKM